MFCSLQPVGDLEHKARRLSGTAGALVCRAISGTICSEENRHDGPDLHLQDKEATGDCAQSEEDLTDSEHDVACCEDRAHGPEAERSEDDNQVHSERDLQSDSWITEMNNSVQLLLWLLKAVDRTLKIAGEYRRTDVNLCWLLGLYMAKRPYFARNPRVVVLR